MRGASDVPEESEIPGTLNDVVSFPMIIDERDHGFTRRSSSAWVKYADVAQGASAHASVYDHAAPSGRSRYRVHPYCLPSPERRRYFRGSMAGLCDPLSMLRRCPRRQLRMTRGQRDSLLLHRDGLAPSAPCRSPGALRFTPDSDTWADTHVGSFVSKTDLT